MPVQDVVGGDNMDIEMLKLTFMLMGLAGGTICGIVWGKAIPSTSWLSKLGIWAMVGIILLFSGLGGTVIVVSHQLQ